MVSFRFAALDSQMGIPAILRISTKTQMFVLFKSSKLQQVRWRRFPFPLHLVLAKRGNLSQKRGTKNPTDQTNRVVRLRGGWLISQNHGNQNPSFLRVTTHILGLKTFIFHGFWGPKETYIPWISEQQKQHASSPAVV